MARMFLKGTSVLVAFRYKACVSFLNHASDRLLLALGNRGLRHHIARLALGHYMRPPRVDELLNIPLRCVRAIHRSGQLQVHELQSYLLVRRHVCRRLLDIRARHLVDCPWRIHSRRIPRSRARGVSRPRVVSIRIRGASRGAFRGVSRIHHHACSGSRARGSSRGVSRSRGPSRGCIRSLLIAAADRIIRRSFALYRHCKASIRKDHAVGERTRQNCLGPSGYGLVLFWFCCWYCCRDCNNHILIGALSCVLWGSKCGNV